MVHWWLMWCRDQTLVGTCRVGVLETILYGGNLMRQLVTRSHGLSLGNINMDCHRWLWCMPISRGHSIRLLLLTKKVFHRFDFDAINFCFFDHRRSF